MFFKANTAFALILIISYHQAHSRIRYQKRNRPNPSGKLTWGSVSCPMTLGKIALLPGPKFLFLNANMAATAMLTFRYYLP